MILSGSELEKRESLYLAPYASQSQKSRGRRFKEKEHAYRTCFQRDRDRIIHSTAFRRLEYKTQVFVNHEADHHRTRLTHTLEVTQIGRTIARSMGLNEDLVEAITLVHDLGHGPFGHAGQDALSALMRIHGGFEHNLQTLRIVDTLENRYPNFEGLNLSFEVRAGIMKHLTKYSLPTRKRLREFDPKKGLSLEAQVTNCADEIAYNCHDLDDGIRAGLLSEDQLKEVSLWQEALHLAHKRKKARTKRHLHHAAIRTLIELQVSDLIKTSTERIRRHQIRTAEDVQKRRAFLIGFSPRFAQRKDALKKALWTHLYHHHRVSRMTEKGKRIIAALFNEYVKRPNQIPPGNLTRIQKDGNYRVICDYIAGMTDRYALDEYSKLFDPHTRV